MTTLHRAGLAGLCMTLHALDPGDFAEKGSWEFASDAITFHWKKTAQDLFQPLIEVSFGIDPQGLITFKAHEKHGMADLKKFFLNSAIKETFLQHPRVGKTEKNVKIVALPFEDTEVTYSYKKLISYPHREPKSWFDARGRYRDDLSVKGWGYPGGTQRHVSFSATTLSNDFGQFLSLIYAPIACLYFIIYHRTPDGKRDARRRSAVVVPHVTDIQRYARNYDRYLAAPVEQLYADSLGESGLKGLLLLNLATPGSMVYEVDIDSCTVFTMGTLPWSKQQKTRTGVFEISTIGGAGLRLFSIAMRTLRNRWFVNEKKKMLQVVTSPCRGLIADNIVAGSNWYQDFYTLMRTKQMASLISRYERKELYEMVKQAEWPHEADKLIVQAVHMALRARYGALAARARARGERIPFDREYERIRTSLMRAKNRQTLRAELADLFVRGGLNKILKEHWETLLPLFTGEDWQRARDLALLALASYSGKGAEEIREISEEDTEDEEV